MTNTNWIFKESICVWYQSYYFWYLIQCKYMYIAIIIVFSCKYCCISCHILNIFKHDSGKKQSKGIWDISKADFSPIFIVFWRFGGFFVGGYFCGFFFRWFLGFFFLILLFFVLSSTAEIYFWNLFYHTSDFFCPHLLICSRKYNLTH